jgi:hypothetical protein
MGAVKNGYAIGGCCNFQLEVGVPSKADRKAIVDATLAKLRHSLTEPQVGSLQRPPVLICPALKPSLHLPSFHLSVLMATD